MEENSPTSIARFLGRVSTMVDVSSDTVQAVSLSYKKDFELPLREGKVLDVAVLKPDNTFSNLWEASLSKKGDVYIYCRDNLSGQEVSLHASGRCHVSHDHERVKNRYIARWKASQDGPVVPAFNLIFPTWGVGLSSEQIARRVLQKKRHEHQLVIAGQERKMVVVSFCIVDSDKQLSTFTLPTLHLATLSLNERRQLLVVAHKEPEKDFRDRMLRSINSVPVPEVVDSKEHGELCLCVVGKVRENTAYMTTFPVTVKQ